MGAERADPAGLALLLESNPGVPDIGHRELAVPPPNRMDSFHAHIARLVAWTPVDAHGKAMRTWTDDERDQDAVQAPFAGGAGKNPRS